MTQKTHALLRRPGLGLPLWLLMVCTCLPRPATAQGDDLCFPNEFSTTQAIYFPLEGDVSTSDQSFSLAAQRARVDSFISDTELVTFIDAFDLGFRYTLVGTHAQGADFSFETCFAGALPNPVQEPVCFGEGLEREGPISVGHSPLIRSTLQGTEPDLVELDATWIQIGTVAMPVRLIERIPGRPQLTLEFWNTRLEVDPSRFELPDACDGVVATLGAPAPVQELFGDDSLEPSRHLLKSRHLRAAAGASVPNHERR
ncbi:MAG: hypothetical protein AAGM22_26105 [Acidobacteriota bacterium]